MKEFCEANAVLAGEGFPPSCAVCTALTAWTTKAVAAADANAAHVSWLAEQAAAAAEVVAEEE